MYIAQYRIASYNQHLTLFTFSPRKLQKILNNKTFSPFIYIFPYPLVNHHSYLSSIFSSLNFTQFFEKYNRV